MRGVKVAVYQTSEKFRCNRKVLKEGLMATDIKVVVFGAAGVGKTSILERFFSDEFHEDTRATIGTDFFVKQLNIDTTTVNLTIWDTAGEERFHCVIPSVLRGASGLILVYDLQNTESIKDLDLYLDLFLDGVGVQSTDRIPVLLLGNKCDIPVSSVGEDITSQWIKKNKITLHFLVSAKTGENVNEAITKLAQMLLTTTRAEELPRIELPKEPQPQKKCDC